MNKISVPELKNSFYDIYKSGTGDYKNIKSSIFGKKKDSIEFNPNPNNEYIQNSFEEKNNSEIRDIKKEEPYFNSKIKSEDKDKGKLFT